MPDQMTVATRNAMVESMCAQFVNLAARYKCFIKNIVMAVFPSEFPWAVEPVADPRGPRPLFSPTFLKFDAEFAEF